MVLDVIARVRQVVLSWFDSRLATIQPNVNQKDHKSTLQELLQSLHKPLPIYEIVEIKGTDNDQIFVVSAKVEGIPEQLGRGTSRRRAEQEAAGLVLNILEQNKK